MKALSSVLQGLVRMEATELALRLTLLLLLLQPVGNWHVRPFVLALAGAEAALAAHLGDMDRAMKAAAEAVQLTPWWGASHLDLHRTRWLYGPLLEHPPFQELIAPRG